MTGSTGEAARSTWDLTGPQPQLAFWDRVRPLQRCSGVRERVCGTHVCGPLFADAEASLLGSAHIFCCQHQVLHQALAPCPGQSGVHMCAGSSRGRYPI